MRIQTVIDDQLYLQAVKLTGLADKRTLLEEALRLLIQSKKTRKGGDMIEQLLQNPLMANGDPAPLKREEIYAERE
jgi:Arc/MetJ family transcription regulator